MRRVTHPRRALTAAGLIGVLLATSACTQDDPGGGAGPGTPSPRSGVDLTLAGVCPATVIIQTDWDPRAEYGAYYHLVPEGKVDVRARTLTGPLVASGRNTGVQLQIRAGGPATGAQQVTERLYTDPTITLGQVSTDEAIQNSATRPTVAVVAPLEISPAMVMWDKARHPEFNTIADVGQSDTAVLYYQPSTFMRYLVGAGIVRDSQLDGGYDGTATKWLAAGSDVALAGFATAEPYTFGTGRATGGRRFDIDYQLVNDTGYPNYGQTLSIRAGDRRRLGSCLAKLVPIIQQAQVDYLKSPTKADNVIIEMTRKLTGAAGYDAATAKAARDALLRDALISNGSNDTLGDLEEPRVRRMIDILTPIFTAQHVRMKANLAPGDLYTNEFIDPAIGYGS